jgi:type II secretory pathway pseudopilin PulG
MKRQVSILPQYSRSCTRSARNRSLAFTRLELLIVVVVALALGAVVLPVLANSRPRSQQAACFNNLRRIGLAYNSWANDYGDRLPYQVDAIPTSSGGSGGTRTHPLSANVWFQFAWISNELATPKILVCPSDPQAIQTTEFTVSPVTGFLHPNYRTLAVSYLLADPGSADGVPFVISGDRNWAGVGVYGQSACSYFGVAYGVPIRNPSVKWTGSIHGNSGNLLLSDGNVRQLDNPGLGETILMAYGYEDGFSLLHIILPFAPQP